MFIFKNTNNFKMLNVFCKSQNEYIFFHTVHQIVDA